MNRLLLSLILVSALFGIDAPAQAQCSGGMMGTEHRHDGSAAPKSGRKVDKKIRQLLSDEQGRASLVEAILQDETFMRDVLERALAMDRWRSLAADLLARAEPPTLPASGAGRANADSQATDFVYRCPMHAEVVSLHPGRCSKCGMSLERAASGTGR